MFLFRLPPTVQSMLGEDETSSIADLAARANALMDAETAKDKTVAAAVEESTVAAAGAAPPSSSRRRKKDWNRKKKKPAANKNNSDGGGGKDLGPWKDMGLCWSHYNWGEERLQLQFSGRLLMWTFLKAEVTFPILGVDFLRANRLLVSVVTNQLVDDSTGDTFRLIEQPSRNTASVMLPGNVQKEWDKPARPKAAPPLVGPGVTYAAMAARGTIRQAAAATTGGGFTFTRKTLPPAAVPSEVDSSMGAAISTSSPLHRQQPPLAPQGRPASTAAPASIGEVLATFQDVLNPKGEPAGHVRRCGTPPPDEGISQRLQVPAAGQRETSRRQEGVLGPRAGQDSPPMDQPVGLTATHGEEARRHMAALRRLPPP